MISNYNTPRDLVKAMKLMVYLGLNTILSGNGSIRLNEYEFLITPSSLPKHLLKTRDLVKYNLINDTYIGLHKPSIEVSIHKCIYKARSEAKAVLHAHPLYTVMLVDKGLLNWWISELIESNYSLGRAIVADPAEPGSIDLAKNICKWVEKEYNILIIPRHGVFSWSTSIWRALESIIALELLAKYFIYGKLIDYFIKN